MENKRQSQLGFGEAEGTHNERKALLARAMTSLHADLYVWRFVWRVFETTDGGAEGKELIKSYRELAEHSWIGLCCSVDKARAVVRKTRDEFGIIASTEQRYVTNGQRPNGYSVHWPEVRRIVTGWPLVPGGTSDQGGGTSDHPYKENRASLPAPSSPVPVPEEPTPGTVRVKSVLESDAPCFAVLKHRRRRANPLPCEWTMKNGTRCSMSGSAFKPLKESHLSDATSMLSWHQHQLSAPRPVYAPYEADQILTVCVALYASKMNATEVKKTRVAVFANMSVKRNFTKALRYLDEAIEAVDNVTCSTASGVS